MIIEIDGKHYRLRYRDPGVLRPEDRGLWRADRVDHSTITGEWFPCDDDDYLITDDRRVIAREIGWDLRKEVEMTDELKPVRCGCGGVAEVRDYKTLSDETAFYVSCRVCDTTTRSFLTKDKAITAWNRAMGADQFRDLTKKIERTAKVIKHKYRIGVSLNVVGEPTIGYEWLCENCKKKVIDGDDYCSHCGAKLIWGEDDE